MRKILNGTLVAALAAAGTLSVPGAAAAAPTVHLKARLVPIPHYPHTGDILGAGAALQSEFTISGEEYGGHPPPLIGVTVDFPAGTRISPRGFSTCPARTLLEDKEPAHCPDGSRAGPPGFADGVVYFGNERVPERVSIEPFFVPGGGLDFFVAGHKPAIIEITSQGRFQSLATHGGVGPRFAAQVPLVETVPGAPDASTERIVTQVGAARRSRGHTVYYGTVPARCPHGGFELRAQLTFAGLGGLAERVVPVTARAPCPRR